MHHTTNPLTEHSFVFLQASAQVPPDAMAATAQPTIYEQVGSVPPSTALNSALIQDTAASSAPSLMASKPSELAAPADDQAAGAPMTRLNEQAQLALDLDPLVNLSQGLAVMFGGAYAGYSSIVDRLSKVSPAKCDLWRRANSSGGVNRFLEASLSMYCIKLPRLDP